MIVSVLYVASTVLLFYLLLNIPNKMTKIVWFPTVFLTYFSFICAIYGIAFLLGSGFNLFPAVVFNGLIIALIYFYKEKLELNRKPKIADKRDILAVCIVAIASIAIFILQFGLTGTINFATSDPARHFYHAEVLYDGGTDQGQFATHLLAAIFMSIICPLIGANSTFFVFAISETILLFLSGWSLYSILCLIADKLNTLIICIITLLYILGYPLNNQIFGFSYLGFAVTVIACIIFLVCNDTLLKWQRNVMLSAHLLLLFFSYSLFVPPIFLALLTIVYSTNRSRNASKADFVKQLLVIFAVPIILGFSLVYLSLFNSSNKLTVGGAISIEGFIFRDLYSSFIFIAPIAIFGFIYLYRERLEKNLQLLSIIFFGFVLILFVGGIFNLVSSYYFFKTYYALWLILFALLGVGVQVLMSKCRAFFISYTLIWGLLFFMFITGLDLKLYNSRYLFNPTPITKMLFQVYDSNFSSLALTNEDRAFGELFEKANDLKSNSNEVNLMVLGDDSFTSWSYPILNLEDEQKWWIEDSDTTLKKLQDADYVVTTNVPSVLTTTDEMSFEDLVEVFLKKNSNVVFENDVGKIVKIEK